MATTQTCDCCGGSMPDPETWEANRNSAGDCDGSVDRNGNCRAWSNPDLWSREDVVYVVRDASGEYAASADGMRRTPASDEAHEFESRQEAEESCTRSTDRVLTREVV